VCYDFLYNFVANISHIQKNSAKYYHKCTYVFMKVPVILVSVSFNLNFRDRFSKNPHISNLLKNRPVGAEIFHAQRRMDRQTDITQVLLASRNLRTRLKGKRVTSFLQASQLCLSQNLSYRNKHMKACLLVSRILYSSTVKLNQITF
jgi:hypothetical protein